MKRKVFLFFILSAFLLTCGFYFFSRNPEAYLHKSLNLLMAGDFNSAEKVLNALQKDYPAFPCQLYQGYIAIAQGRLKLAEKFIGEAIESKDSVEREHELLLTRGLLSFLNKKDEEFHEILKGFSKGPLFFPESHLLKGLDDYLSKNYEEALEAWVSYEEFKDSPSCFPWLKWVLEVTLPESWLQMHIAHCFIDEGDLGTAQQILEKELKHPCESPYEKDQKGLAYLFLGLASLKEATFSSLEEKPSDYQLASYYFEKSGHSPGLSRERACVIEKLCQEVTSLLQIPELQGWANLYIKLLENWRASEALAHISRQLTEELKSAKFDNPSLLLLQQEIREGVFRSLLLAQLIDEALIAVSNKDFETLNHLWTSIHLLDPENDREERKLAQAIENEIIEAISSDCPSLKNTKEWLTEWKRFQKDPSNHFQFAQILLGHGQQLWKKEGQELKGTALMQLAYTLVSSDGKPFFLKQIEKFLTALYSEAEQANLIDRLTLIYETLEKFHLASASFTTPAALANLLADADYLFISRRYVSAQTHAAWVLKFNPNSQDALRLLGLASYYLGDYSKATNALGKLEKPDEICRKALIISSVFCDESGDASLAQGASLPEDSLF